MKGLTFTFKLFFPLGCLSLRMPDGTLHFPGNLQLLLVGRISIQPILGFLFSRIHNISCLLHRRCLLFPF